MKYISVILILLSLCVIIPDEGFAQDKEKLSGSLYSDSRTLMKDYKAPEHPEIFYPANGKKSLLLGGALSAVVPGAGEIYAGRYIKGAVFLLLEAAAIYTAVEYNQKGDIQTERFQRVADEQWSVVRYARWIMARFPDVVITINDDPSLKPWQQVMWSEINNAEGVYNVGSHKLPPYGDQQYYELIGKYHQFSAGWDDFNINGPGGLDPAPAPSPNFLAYSAMRGDANDLYNVSSKAVIVIMVNHIISTLDAIWSTSNYNKDLAISMKFQESNYAFNRELAPVLNIRYSF